MIARDIYFAEKGSACASCCLAAEMRDLLEQWVRLLERTRKLLGDR